MFHPIAWSLWVVAAAMPAMLTQNPLYLSIICLAAGIVYASVRHTTPLAASWNSFLKLGLTLLAFTVPINALSVHAGRLVLFSLPPSWPLIGGPITVEAIIFGVSKALSLFTLLLIFAVFNCAVDQSRLLRWTPAFLFEAGLITSIALTFVPQMLRNAQEIREAQIIRGHRFRGLRDLLPLFVPLLTGGLERAVQLAESMEARGFGGSLESLSHGREIAVKVATAAGLLGLLGGFFSATYFPDRRALSWLLLLPSIGALLFVFRVQSKRVHRSRYHHDTWQRRDTVLAAVSAGLALTLLLVRAGARSLLTYYPYPPFSPWPSFNLWLGSAFTLLLVPALLSSFHPPRQPLNSLVAGEP